MVNVTTDVYQASATGAPEEGQGIGTGFIVRPNGVVVTNCHVVQGASRITVFTSEDEPTRYDARVIGGDCEHDLAVLKVDADGPPDDPVRIERGPPARPAGRGDRLRPGARGRAHR